MPRRGYDSGTTLYSPHRSRRRPTGQSRDFTDLAYGDNPRLTCDAWWDFTGVAANYLIGNAGTLATSITGSGPPTVSQVANSANGEVAMALEATGQTQFAGVDFDDELNIPATSEFFFEAYIKTPLAALVAAQDIVVGLATAYNSTLASISKYVWFRMSGSNVVIVEGKDGTTTNLAQPTSPSTTINNSTATPSLTVAPYTLFTIDAHKGAGQIRFFLDDNLVATLSQSAFASTDLLQPLIGIRKQTASTTTGILTMDFLRIAWSRI